MKGFQEEFDNLIRQQLLSVVEKLWSAPDDETLWQKGQFLLSKKRPYNAVIDDIVEEEDDESSSGSMSLHDDDDEDDLEIQLDDGGAQAYRLITSVDDWETYLRSPYARRTFWDALQVVINNREHGNIRECFDTMLSCIDSVKFVIKKTGTFASCDLCNRKRSLTYTMTTDKGNYQMGSNCGALMKAIHTLMQGIWDGDETAAIRANFDAVIEANKEYRHKN
jgi:hypothetical protein